MPCTGSSMEDIYVNNRDLDEFLGDNISKVYSEARTKPEKDDFSTVYFQNPMRLKPLVASSRSKKTPFAWQTKDALLGVGVSVVRKSASEKVLCVNESADSCCFTGGSYSEDRDAHAPYGDSCSSAVRASAGKSRSQSQSLSQYPSYIRTVLPSDGSGTSNSRANISTYAHSQSSAYDSDDLSIASDSNQSDSVRGRKVKKINKASPSVQAHPLYTRSCTSVQPVDRSSDRVLTEIDTTHTEIKSSTHESSSACGSPLYTSSNPAVRKTNGGFSSPRLHGSFPQRDTVATNGNRIPKEGATYGTHGSISGGNGLLSGCTGPSSSSSDSDSTPIVDFIPPLSGDHSSPLTEARMKSLSKRNDDLLVPVPVSVSVSVSAPIPQTKRSALSSTPSPVPCAPQPSGSCTTMSIGKQANATSLSPPLPCTAANASITPSSAFIATPNSLPSPKSDYLIKANDIVVGVISKRIQEKMLTEMNCDENRNENYSIDDTDRSPKCNTLAGVVSGLLAAIQAVLLVVQTP